MFSILNLNKNKLKKKITDVSLGHYSNRNHQRNSQPEIDHWRVTAPFFSLSKLSQTNISFVRLAFSISEIGPYPRFCRTPAKRVFWTDSQTKNCILTNSTWSLFSISFISSLEAKSWKRLSNSAFRDFITVTRSPILGLISAFGSKVVLSRSVGKLSHSQLVSCDS